MQQPTMPPVNQTDSLRLFKKVSQKINPVFEWRLLLPKNWPTWILMGFWWLLVQLPYPLLILLGRGAGRLLMMAGDSRRLITSRNLELCFPDKTPDERKKILVESFESAGVAFIEMGMAWWWPDWRLKKLCRVEGLENVQALQGQGAVLLGMHFTTLDIGGRGLSLYQSYGSMYRAHENPVFNYVQFRGRQRKSVHNPNEKPVIFPREDLRTMVRLLREGKLVWYAADQDYGIAHGVFAPLFGIPAATITATAKLVQMGKAAVLPFTHTRLPRFKGYCITIHPPLKNYPVGNDLEDATTTNRVIEHHIRQNPGQYLWAHRRFKSRPSGVDNRYPEIYPARLARRLKRNARKRKLKVEQDD